MLRKYDVISPPFTLRFAEMSKRELAAYFEWFMSILPTRRLRLEEAITTTPGFEGWLGDDSPESLDILGSWFARHIRMRARTDAERGELYAKAPAWFSAVAVPDQELTDETFSMAIDVGMYVSQVFLANCSAVRWKHQLGSKKDVDYGQPVLEGFGRTVFNPVRMMVTVAYGLADGTYGPSRVREVYDYWARLAKC